MVLCDGFRHPAALAKQAGLPGDLRAVSGPELAEMSEGEFAQTAAEATVFGRISPQQKEQLVAALRKGDIEVAVLDSLDATEYARQGDFAVVGQGLTRQFFGIALRKGSTLAAPINAAGMRNGASSGRYWGSVTYVVLPTWVVTAVGASGYSST